MSYKRRTFIKTTSAALAITALTGKLTGCNSSTQINDSGRGKEFGLQLYTLRDVMPKDPKGVLKQVAKLGYTQIESYNHDKLGMFWGMSNIEFKKYLDEIGLTIVSSHYKPDNNFEKKSAEAAAIGIKYLIYPYEGSPFKKHEPEYATMPKTLEDFKKWAEQFNHYGEICKKNGIRFAYHNHDYTFYNLQNQIPQQIILDNTDKDLVYFEMDVYWVVTAGHDPISWLKKYPDRFKLLHLKDRKKSTVPSDKETFSILGKGIIDIPAIIKTAKQTGIKYYIVEQDETYETPLWDAVKQNAEYLKKII